MGVAFIADGGKPWGVSGACVFGVFYYACLQMRAKERVGVRVSEKPELVYWVHPTVLSQALSKDSILSVSLITLHLRDATQFEVSMAPNEMRSFIEWLQSRNPAVRIGPYESDRSRQIG